MSLTYPTLITRWPAVSVVATVATAACCVQAAAIHSDSTTTLATVQVTASKRQEALQDAPMAVSTLTAATLQVLGVERLDDYTGLIPNLAISKSVGEGVGNVIVRGINTGSLDASATTATYIGEAPLTFSNGLSLSSYLAPDPSLFNVERVEVLKGPQGTLFGATGLGGVLRIIPARPNLRETFGQVRLGGTQVEQGGRGTGLRAMVNVPLQPGMAAVSATAFSRTDPGYTTNLTTGSTNLSESKLSGGSVLLRVKPSPELDLGLRLLTQQTDTYGFNTQDNLKGSGIPVDRNYSHRGVIDAKAKTQYAQVELTCDYTTQRGTLTAVLSQTRARQDLEYDLTPQFIGTTVGLQQLYGALYGPGSALGFPYPGLAVSVPGTAAPTATMFPAGVTGRVSPNTDKTSLELRFVSKKVNQFEFLAGMFLTKEDERYRLRSNHVNADGSPVAGQVTAVINTLGDYKSNTGIPGFAVTATGLVPAGTLYDLMLRPYFDESAVFGNATYYVSDQLDASVGLRHARSDQTIDVSSDANIGFLNYGSYRVSTQDSATTYQATLRYRPGPTLSTYVRVASGYRPGGSNFSYPTAPAYKADTVFNFEMGLKGSAGPWTFDTSVYRIDWKDTQLNFRDATTALVISNAGAAQVNGLEAQLGYRPTDALTLGVALGYNRARITNISAVASASSGVVLGDRLPGAPEWTAALVGDYRMAVGHKRVLTVGASAKYQGDKNAAYSGATLRDVNFNMPAYSTVDLRATMAWARYQLRFAIDNATNTFAYSGYDTVVPTTSAPSQANVIRPRTLSVNLTVDF
jgi:outer membrane receptor protein involved in Fe transport